MRKNAYSVAEVAELLSVHPETVRRAIRDGHLDAFKLVDTPSSPWRITSGAIERMMLRSGRVR